jgi:anti-anti-sigma factor
MSTSPDSTSRDQADAATSLSVEVHERLDVTVLVIEGEVDMSNSPLLEQFLDLALAKPCPALVVDMTGVEFLGSSGLAALVHAQQRAPQSTPVRVAADNDAVLRPLQITGLLQQFDLYSSVPAAVAGNRRGPLPSDR